MKIARDWGGNSSELTAPASHTAEQHDKLAWRNAAKLYGIKGPAIPFAIAAR
jgi:hypothetical protein